MWPTSDAHLHRHNSLTLSLLQQHVPAKSVLQQSFRDLRPLSIYCVAGEAAMPRRFASQTTALLGSRHISVCTFIKLLIRCTARAFSLMRCNCRAPAPLAASARTPCPTVHPTPRSSPSGTLAKPLYDATVRAHIYPSSHEAHVRAELECQKRRHTSLCVATHSPSQLRTSDYACAVSDVTCYVKTMTCCINTSWSVLSNPLQRCLTPSAVSCRPAT